MVGDARIELATNGLRVLYFTSHFPFKYVDLA